MKLTQEVIDQIQEAMLHTKMNGDVNWQDGDEIDVCLGGTFAGDKFISIINRTRSNTTKNENTKQRKLLLFLLGCSNGCLYSTSSNDCYSIS